MTQSQTVVPERYFIVHPAYYEEIDENGDNYDYEDSTLYSDLVVAGYPITKDDSLGRDYIDLSVEGDKVTVYTANPAAEHDMGAASALFLLAMHPPVF